MNTTCTPVETERTVLYVSNSPDQDLASFLAASGWQVMHARNTATAERLIERGNIKVGLVELPSDCTSQYLSVLASCMRRVETNWVAQIAPGQAENELVSRFILDYCFDFVTRPWLNDRLVFALGHAHGLSSLRHAPVAPEPSLGRHGMVGQCEAMQQLYRRIDKCSATEAPVFVAGESGTGKELTARAIHERSPRAGQAFVAINCAAIPPSLLQAELFGHERGAFTGALQRKIGRIESANEGTLFLDEIGDMPHECQAVLLRFLQEGTIERLGGNGPIKVDVRVISATHVDLDRAVEDGRFRSDLYHRLCVLRRHQAARQLRAQHVPAGRRAQIARAVERRDRRHVELCVAGQRARADQLRAPRRGNERGPLYHGKRPRLAGSRQRAGSDAGRDPQQGRKGRHRARVAAARLSTIRGRGRARHFAGHAVSPDPCKPAASGTGGRARVERQRRGRRRRSGAARAVAGLIWRAT
jgi:DNA-binding NtrC family response regulator